MRARLKTETQDVWQYLEVGHARPLWVFGCTEYRNSKLILMRRSGKQLIEPGDYLLRDLDGEPTWMTDTEFRRKYEIISDKERTTA